MLKNQAPTEAALQLQTVSDLIQRKEIVKISKKFVFRYSNLLFMKQQLSLSIIFCFSNIPPMETIFEILVMSVMKTADVNFF